MNAGGDDIERFKTFKSLSSYLTKDDCKALLSQLGISEEGISHREYGIDSQNEFILILKYLDCCKSVMMFNESVSALFKSHTPDLLVILNNGRKYCIEVKSTQKNSLKMSRKYIKDINHTSAELGCPLLFAVKMHGNWVILPEDYITHNGGKVDIVKDLRHSLVGSVFGSVTLQFPGGLEIWKYVDKEKYLRDGKSRPHKLSFHYDNALITSLDEPDNAFFVDLNLRLLIDHMDIVSEEETENAICIRKRLRVNTFVWDHQLFVRNILYLEHKKHGRHSATTYLQETIENDELVVKKEMLESVVGYLQSQNVPIGVMRFVPGN